MQSSATAAGTILSPRHGYAYEHPSTAMQSLNSYSRTTPGYGSLGGPEPTMAPSWSSYASIAPSPLPVSAPQITASAPNPTRYSPYHGANYSMAPRLEHIPASYDPVNVQLPPIRPAYPSHPAEASATQQRRPEYHQQVSGTQVPSTNGISQQPEAKRPRMDIRGILE